MVRYTTASFIEKAVAIHGNNYEYNRTIYVHYKQKLKIVCKLHGDFDMTPNAHIGPNKQGCPQCGIIKRSTINKRTIDKFKDDAIAIHGATYDYSKSDYINCNTKLIVICKLHGEFMITPTHHLRRIGCAICGTIRTSNANRLSTSEFIERAIKIHNGKYDYSKLIYIDSKSDICVICNIHGEFMQNANNHLCGSGCDKCAFEYRGLLLRLTSQEFIEKANRIHNNKYDYTKIEYHTTQSLLTIICHEHGEFQQKAGAHLNGYGCTPCGYRDLSNATRCTQDEIIQKFINVHGNRYNYNDVSYTIYNAYVKIICKEHGIFNQTPHAHIVGQGCPQCARQNNRISYISQEWLSMIKVSHPFLHIEYRIPNTQYWADGYDPETNTIYEFHGNYWHGNPNMYDPDEFNEVTKCTMGDLYYKTIIKKQKCISLGYNYVEIWENKWNKCKKLIRMVQIRFRNQSKA